MADEVVRIRVAEAVQQGAGWVSPGSASRDTFGIAGSSHRRPVAPALDSEDSGESRASPPSA